MQLQKYIDHTLLKASATEKDILELCDEALKFNFYAVCINGAHIPLVKSRLKGSPIKIAAVVGFPLGAMTTKSKVMEAEDYSDQGADEIDMVLNIGWLKSGKLIQVKEDIAQVKSGIGTKVLKVILETCYLTDEEKQIACRLAMEANADLVKTSTGFGPAGATFKDVLLLKQTVGDSLQIKASGGIKDRATALKYIELGASRIGTSSGTLMLAARTKKK
ncbi:Deoxyribose-phosphate aldolase [Arenibacter antarcticus]|uniref:Deoxyribose-phosphate aldolase n=1 Tax=Arenibacter antarcticus TaxID=2040469 RepID=A0ABW5VBQ8_9FLAO|nr:deoxyribose-phosphate aldolase [Arenibacter sp. H213]MCM4169339.1 deoxyribose-phosphate aldolase [Arenibacter sp. H213]